MPITGDRKEHAVGIHWVQREFTDKEEEDDLQVKVEVIRSFHPQRVQKACL